MTEDLKTAQTMALALMAMQAAVAAIGLAAVKVTIPLKLFRNMPQNVIQNNKGGTDSPRQ